MIDPYTVIALPITFAGENTDYTLSMRNNSLRVVTHKANELERFIFSSSAPSMISSLRFTIAQIAPNSTGVENSFDEISGFVLHAFDTVKMRTALEKNTSSSGPKIILPPFVGFEITVYECARTIPLTASIQQLAFQRFTDENYRRHLAAKNYPCDDNKGLGVNRYFLPWTR